MARYMTDEELYDAGYLGSRGKSVVDQISNMAGTSDRWQEDQYTNKRAGKDDIVAEINRMAREREQKAQAGSYGDSGGSGNGGDGMNTTWQKENYQNPYEEYLRAAQEEAAKRLQAQIDQGVNRLESQKGTLKNTFEDSAQQAYIMSMQAKRDLPQQLAAQGLSGGASESANLALDTQYMNNVNDLQRDYNNGLAAIDSDIANLRASGDIAIAESNNDYAQQLAAAAAQAQEKAEALRQSYLQQAQNNAANQNRQKALAAMIASGNPSAWLNSQEAAGYDTDTYSWLLNQYNTMNQMGLTNSAANQNRQKAFAEMMASSNPRTWLNSPAAAKYDLDTYNWLLNQYGAMGQAGVLNQMDMLGSAFNDIITAKDPNAWMKEWGQYLTEKEKEQLVQLYNTYYGTNYELGSSGFTNTAN